MREKNIFCSWSGGKDSCLAMHRAVGEGGNPRYLLTMLTEGGSRSRSHGLDISVIRAQAQALAVPLLTGQASWQNYEEVFTGCLEQMKGEAIQAGVFGDIDIEDHLGWVEKVCDKTGLEAWLPLWKGERDKLLAEFIGLGYRALIVSTREDLADLLGREMNHDLIIELKERKIDPCGEQGEFHTVVVDGPLFSRPVRIEPGESLFRDGYAFLDYTLPK